MNQIFGRVVLLGMMAAGIVQPAQAEETAIRGVVELFTSQGCSSCPPADEALGQLIEEGDVVALAYHVDYWDYLGWKDTLGSPQNTMRQKEYGKSLKSRGVYTPQAVINGRTHMNGQDLQGIRTTISTFEDRGRGLDVPVSMRRDGDRIHIEVGEKAGMPEANLVLVYFDEKTDITVAGGENRGKTLTYNHPVSDFETIGMWNGQKQAIEIPVSEINKKGSGGCALLVQSIGKDGLPGPIIGAAWISS